MARAFCEAEIVGIEAFRVAGKGVQVMAAVAMVGVTARRLPSTAR